jgi:hypothetical protein
MIAQATTDISSVPADFVKNFLIMLAFVFGGSLGVLFARKGTKKDPLSIEQPLSVDASVTHAPEFARQTALDKLRADMEARTRENLRQHDEHSSRLAEIITAGHERQERILSALSEMETRMTQATLKELKDIHQRLNPLAESTAGHAQAIKGLDDRIKHLWEMIQALWSQVFRKSAPRS